MCIGPFGSDLLSSDLVDAGVPVVFVRNVRPGRFDPKGLRYVTAAKADRLRAHRVRGGDIVVTKMGLPPCIAASYPMDAPDGIITADIIKVTPDPSQVDPAYLVRFLNSQLAREQVARFTFGVTRPKVTLKDFRGLRVHLPPLPEQRRIADILDKADAIRRKRRDAITLTEELLRSTFLQMFGDPVTNAKQWEVKRLGEVIERFEAGWSANGEARSHGPDEYGVLKISAVTSGWFRPEEYKAVAAAAVDRELMTPRRGDLLFSRANTRELVAATCLVEDAYPRLFLPDKLWRVVPNASATTPFLRFLLAHDRQRAELTKTATGTSGSMLNISMEKLKSLLVPVPPIDTQERFAEIVWASLASKQTLVLAARRADELFASLVDRAFRGELSGAAKKQPGLFAGGEELHP